jgi:hypothetical protein
MEENWIEKITQISCWMQSKHIIWDTFVYLIKFGTDLVFISQFLEFVYNCKINNSFSISMVLCDLFSNRRFFSQKFLSENLMIHKFTQNIFIEAFKFIQSQDSPDVFQYLQSNFETIEFVLQDGTDQVLQQIPIHFIRGLLDFISYPIGNSVFIHSLDVELRKSFLDVCFLVLAAYSFQSNEGVLTPQVAEKIIFSFDPQIASKSIEVMNMNHKLQTLGSFGLQPQTNSLLVVSLRSHGEEEISQALSELSKEKIENLKKFLQSQESNETLKMDVEKLGRLLNISSSDLLGHVKNFLVDEDKMQLENEFESSSNQIQKRDYFEEKMISLISLPSETLIAEVIQDLMKLSEHQSNLLNSNHFLPLMRLLKDLSSKNKALMNLFNQLIQSLIQMNSMVDPIVKYILSLYGDLPIDSTYSKDLKIIPLQLSLQLSGIQHFDSPQVEDKIKLIGALSKIGSCLVEEVLKDLMNMEMNDKIISQLFLQFMNQEENEMDDERNQKRRKLNETLPVNILNIRNHGILFDYLYRMDPSISNDSLRNFIFKWESNHELHVNVLNSNERKNLVPYMLILLKQNTRTENLTEMNQQMLNLKDYTNLDFENVLQFIHSFGMISLNRKYSSKFTAKITQFLFKELSNFMRQSFTGNRDSSLFIENHLKNIELFLDTLKSEENMKLVVDWLMKQNTEESNEMISWIYCQFPERIMSIDGIHSISPNSFLPSKFDKKIHKWCLLLTDNEISTMSFTMLKNYSSLYPKLMLKHLGLFSSLLEDPYSLEYYEIQHVKKIYFPMLEVLKKLVPFISTEVFLILF